MITKEENKAYPYKVVIISAYKKTSQLIYSENLNEARELAKEGSPWDYVAIIKGDIIEDNK